MKIILYIFLCILSIATQSKAQQGYGVEYIPVPEEYVPVAPTQETSDYTAPDSYDPLSGPSAWDDWDGGIDMTETLVEPLHKIEMERIESIERIRAKENYQYHISRARNGDIKSMGVVVHLYENGIGTKKNYKKAKYWLKKIQQQKQKAQVQIQSESTSQAQTETNNDRYISTYPDSDSESNIGIVITVLIILFLIVLISSRKDEQQDTTNSFGKQKDIKEDMAYDDKYDEKTYFLDDIAVLMGKVSHADGTLSQEEIKVAENFFASAKVLEHTELSRLKRLFRAANNTFRSFEYYANRLANQDKDIKEAILDILFLIAMADGILSAEEELLLLEAEVIFDIKSTMYHKYRSHHKHKKTNNKEYYLSVLGLNLDATQDEIKKTYRKLAKQFHPDKVHHFGKEFLQEAEIKMKKINEAYEYLKNL